METVACCSWSFLGLRIFNNFLYDHRAMPGHYRTRKVHLSCWVFKGLWGTWSRQAFPSCGLSLCWTDIFFGCWRNYLINTFQAHSSIIILGVFILDCRRLSAALSSYEMLLVSSRLARGSAGGWNTMPIAAAAVAAVVVMSDNIIKAERLRWMMAVSIQAWRSPKWLQIPHFIEKYQLLCI